MELLEQGMPAGAPDAEAERRARSAARARRPTARCARATRSRGFKVLDAPGHSPGHVAYWRESDRALILGDVLFGMHPLLGIRQLREPPDFFTPDPAQNRESARKLAALEPALVCFGHGPPLRDTKKLHGLRGRPRARLSVTTRDAL